MVSQNIDLICIKKGTDLFLVDHWGEFWHEKSGSEEPWGQVCNIAIQYCNKKR
jgi:hypothetical protein